MKNILDKIEQMEKDLNDLKQLVKGEYDKLWPVKRNPYTYPEEIPIDITVKPYGGRIDDIPCVWDTIPKEDWNKPMGISCPCRKCRPFC